MALTADIKTVRYGVGDGREPANYGLGAGVTVYRGSVAVLNGTGAHQGVLKNASTVATTDIIVGIVQKVGQGCGQIDGAPGITGGATDGAVTVEVEQGTFFLGSSTGADALGVSTIGQAVYLYNENTVAATNGSGTRPIAGIHVATDTSGKYPGGYAIKLGSNQTQTQAIGGGF